ncbi:MAG: ATP-dependent DNA helicase RecG [Treponema sp.]|nr:ATP-dependent DNA helicase RecG [Treponema sp.]
MRLSEIQTPISSLPGVGPAMQKQFANLNVWTICDLLNFFPRSYKDRTKRIALAQFETAKEVHTIAIVVGHEWFGYGKMKTLKILIADLTARAELICFNRPFMEKSFPVGSIIAVTGSFFVKYNALQSSAFEAELVAQSGALEDYENAAIPGSGILPVYKLTAGLTQKKVYKVVAAALSQCGSAIDNDLSDDIIARRGLLQTRDAIKTIHQPKDFASLQDARRTLIYQELFDMQMAVLQRAVEHKGSLPAANLESLQELNGPQSSDGMKGGETDSANQKASKDLKAGGGFSPRQAALLERLPFALTKDQMAAIERINGDIDRGYDERAKLLKASQDLNGGSSAAARAPWTMQRLLQGDVGAGKTLVALFACLRVIDWGGQCAIMAPTEILAKQHAETSARLLEAVGVRAAFLSGTISAAQRAPLLKALKAGEINILIGTHALFSKTTVYKDLQLVVVDEQHRFGVTQRQAIVEKGKALAVAANDGKPKNGAAKTLYISPHLLMMSATPIPQSLALTVYGDLDVTVIKSLPAGRKPITTYLVAQGHESNAYGAVLRELQKGRQAYFVYPAIGEDDCGAPDSGLEDTSGLKSATAAFENLSRNVFPGFRCALLHSKVPEEEQSKILNDFRQNKIQVLAATTVVEVGVDVPNATCMVIEQADRFGLAQLHQLRGRVGRGSEQSYCFLIYSKDISQNGIERMKILRQSTDGFYIAEEDLKLRGPGQITGTAQSGALELGLADLSRDRDLLMLARLDAREELAATFGST